MLLVSANISVQSSIAHVLLSLLFVADKNPILTYKLSHLMCAWRLMTTIYNILMFSLPLKELLLLSLLHASIKQRSEVLPFPRLLSDHRSIPISSPALPYSSNCRSDNSDRIWCLWCCRSLKWMNGWMEMNEWMDDDDYDDVEVAVIMGRFVSCTYTSGMM